MTNETPNDLREIATIHDLAPEAIELLRVVNSLDYVMEITISSTLRARIRALLRKVDAANA